MQHYKINNRVKQISRDHYYCYSCQKDFRTNTIINDYDPPLVLCPHCNEYKTYIHGIDIKQYSWFIYQNTPLEEFVDEKEIMYIVPLDKKDIERELGEKFSKYQLVRKKDGKFLWIKKEIIK